MDPDVRIGLLQGGKGLPARSASGGPAQKSARSNPDTALRLPGSALDGALLSVELSAQLLLVTAPFQSDGRAGCRMRVLWDDPPMNGSHPFSADGWTASRCPGESLDTQRPHDVTREPLEHAPPDGQVHSISLLRVCPRVLHAACVPCRRVRRRDRGVLLQRHPGAHQCSPGRATGYDTRASAVLRHAADLLQRRIEVLRRLITENTRVSGSCYGCAPPQRLAGIFELCMQHAPRKITWCTISQSRGNM